MKGLSEIVEQNRAAVRALAKQGYERTETHRMRLVTYTNLRTGARVTLQEPILTDEQDDAVGC